MYNLCIISDTDKTCLVCRAFIQLQIITQQPEQSADVQFMSGIDMYQGFIYATNYKIIFLLEIQVLERSNLLLLFPFKISEQR